MKPLTELGMLKMDFLGLKTLTVIDEAEKLIRRVPDFDIRKMPLRRPADLRAAQRGMTTAVFQMESGGMMNTCKNSARTRSRKSSP
jgi:DNA polymerase III subunit alpha